MAGLELNCRPLELQANALTITPPGRNGDSYRNTELDWYAYWYALWPLIHMIRFVASSKLTYFLYPVDLCDIVYGT